MLDETLAHFVRKRTPSGDEGGWILAVAGAQLVVEDGGEDAAQLLHAVGTG